MHDAFEEPVTPDDLRRWLGEDARPPDKAAAAHHDRRAPGRRTRSTLLILAAALPWLLAGALIVTGALPSSQAPPDAGRTEPPRSSARRSAAAGAVAVRLVRDAVTSTGDDAATALDAAAAERPDPLHDDTWIVRVHVVVLHGDRRRWRSATHEIWAAPIGRRGGALVGLDRPWRVARSADRIADVRWEPAAVDLDEVRAALRRAGRHTTPDLRVEEHPHLPSVLRAVVGQGPREDRVWLRSTPTVEVLGHDRTVQATP